MSKYWPDRSIPEGFSIEKLAKRYRERFSSVVDPIESYVAPDSVEENVVQDCYVMHWANRDFKEYHEAA